MSELENGMEIDGLEEIEVENTAVDELESENINLIFLGIDESGSMFDYRFDMKKCLMKFWWQGLISPTDIQSVDTRRSLNLIPVLTLLGALQCTTPLLTGLKS